MLPRYSLSAESSRDTNRPSPDRTPFDFERFFGSEVNLRLRVPLSGRKNFNGVLRGLQNGTVTLALETGDVALAFDNIDKARLVPKFD